VNSAVYLTYLEEGRGAFLAKLFGIGRVWPYSVVRVSVDFRREVTLADEAVIPTISVARIGQSSVATTERLHTLSGDLVAEGECVIVARDEASGGSRRLDEFEREALRRQAEDAV
jgi:acyl-CoA thioesterase FadM